MKTKLTLSVEPEAIASVKRLARERGVSVSSLFEQWSARMAKRLPEESLGTRMRGRWQTVSESKDPRLDYLLEKHAGR